MRCLVDVSASAQGRAGVMGSKGEKGDSGGLQVSRGDVRSFCDSVKLKKRIFSL